MNRLTLEGMAREALVKLAVYFGTSVPHVHFEWTLKGKSCLGQAYGDRMIRLHPEALAKLGDAYLNTVLHEACHVATTRAMRERGITSRTGRWSAHGLEWSKAMRHLGLEPSRCATLPADVTLTPARKVRRFEVACSCRTHEVTSVRLKRLETLRCRACNGSLRLVGEVQR